ncbi:MAG: hypothetical protein PHT60_01195 [Acidiphilium sp.]|nr:hypothetical protein [Acidiphilium sp.]MDD4934372.1 hypothetical protein [Acidiphilium sp.]
MRGDCAVVLLLAVALAGCSAAQPPAVTSASTAPVPVMLVGTSVSDLRADLGVPALQRVDGSAQVWLYDSPVCRLNIVLYPGPSGTPQVSAAMPMPRGVSQSACVASLEQNRGS